MDNAALGYRAGLEICLSYALSTPNNCAVRERTGDGRSVGACCYYLAGGTTCPRHGVVKIVREDSAKHSKKKE